MSFLSVSPSTPPSGWRDGGELSPVCSVRTLITRCNPSQRSLPSPPPTLGDRARERRSRGEEEQGRGGEKEGSEERGGNHFLTESTPLLSSTSHPYFTIGPLFLTLNFFSLHHHLLPRRLLLLLRSLFSLIPSVQLKTIQCVFRASSCSESTLNAQQTPTEESSS